jgi:hypothetical protein
MEGLGRGGSFAFLAASPHTVRDQDIGVSTQQTKVRTTSGTFALNRASCS